MLGQATVTSKYLGKSILSIGSPDTDFAMHIPHLPIKYNAKFLPTYNTALSRSEEEYLAAEDLDNIQLELENLLSKVALRFRVLKSEYDILDKDEKRIDRRSKHGDKQPSSPGKRKREDYQRKSKGFILKIAKHKSNQVYSPAPYQNTDDNADTMQYVTQQKEKFILPKNDVPNKFWLSVEPYCMPLTNEDLKLLDDLLDQYTGPLVPPIPDLGEHYSKTWSTEDVKNVQNTSNLRSKLNTPPSSMCQITNYKPNDCVTGPLTQRLVSALMEENIKSDLSNVDSNSSSENTNYSNYTLWPFSFMKNGVDIEKQLKKELLKQGLLDNKDFQKDGDDEILSEIKKLISELSSVSEYNGNALRILREAASDEIRRLEIKRKLDMVDHEVLETYKRTVLSKAKRKLLSIEEQQDVLRTTSEQKILSDKLERIN